jgi:hypothetical protein
MIETPTVIEHFFNEEQILYVTSLPETIKAKTDLLSTAPNLSPSFLSSVDFTINLTPEIQEIILDKFQISLENNIVLPMKWVIGNIPMHFDTSIHEFEHTYLIYLNDSGGGDLVIHDVSYPIIENTGFKFQEGLSHYTNIIGQQPRLLLGPMNELGEKVGLPSTIFYVDLQGNSIGFNHVNSYIVGDIDIDSVGNESFGYNQNYTKWYIQDVNDNNGEGIVSPATKFYNNGDILIGNTIDNNVAYLLHALVITIYYYPSYQDAQNQTNLLGFNCSHSEPYYHVGTIDPFLSDYPGFHSNITNYWKIYQQTGSNGSPGENTIYKNGDVLNGEFNVGLFTNTYILYNVADQSITMKSLFSDNSRVYYKPGSLASCGVGGVTNSRKKLKYT